MRVQLQLVPTEQTDDVTVKGMDLVAKAIDPEIARFEDWFRSPERGNGSLIPLEREILRSYLYQKLVGKL